MSLTTATRRKAKNTEAKIVIPSEGKYTYRDPETRDWPMYLDGQFVGAARTETEADTTLDTLVDEIQRHTRATTADMAADAAASVDAELAAQGLRLADEDEAGWYVLISGGKHVWATDDPPHFDNPVATPIFEAPIPTPPARDALVATPPRAVGELQDELNAITDAIHDRKAVGAGYANLHRMRRQIIAELNAAHKAEDAALRQRILGIITPNYAELGDDPEGDDYDQFQQMDRDADDLTTLDRSALARMAADDPCAGVRAALEQSIIAMEGALVILSMVRPSTAIEISQLQGALDTARAALG